MSDLTDGAVRIEPFGDSALLVVLGDEIDPKLNNRVHRLAAAVRALRARDGRWGVPVPAYSTLLAPYDPALLGHVEAIALLRDWLEASGDSERGPGGDDGSVVTLPVRYGGADGPDLERVASLAGLSQDEVVELHTGSVYQAFMLGFAPGFAYLGPLAPELATPRRETPRPRVPAGSVAVAGRQTAVYPLSTPGGWHLIGRTESVIWDHRREPPALLAPGQRVRFERRS